MSFFERFINKNKKKSKEELRIEKVNSKLPYGVHVKIVGQLPNGVALDADDLKRIGHKDNAEKTAGVLHITHLKVIAQYIKYPEIALQVAKYVNEGHDESYILDQLRWSGLQHLGHAMISILSRLDNPTLEYFEEMRFLKVGISTKEQEDIFDRYMLFADHYKPFLEMYGLKKAKDTMKKPLIYARDKIKKVEGELLAFASWAKLRGDKDIERLILSVINDYHWDELKKESSKVVSDSLLLITRDSQDLKLATNINDEQWMKKAEEEIENMNTQNLLTTDYLSLGQEYYVIDVTGVIFPIAQKTSPVVQFVTQCGSRVHFLLENAGRFNLERACEITESGILGTVGLALVPTEFFKREAAQPNEVEFYQYATLRYYDPTIAEWTERFKQLKENGVFITVDTEDGTPTLELFTDIASVYNYIQVNSDGEMDVRSVVANTIKDKSFRIAPFKTLKCLVTPNFLPEIAEVM